jgi:hypothetical protein
MTLIKKCDVKTYFASRHGKRLHLVQQIDKPAAAASPLTDMPIESDVSAFVEDFSLEHSSPGGTVSAVVMDVNLDEAQIPEAHSTPRS